jgi:hypothetical protein
LPQIFLYIYILPGFPTNASEFSSFVTRLRACTLLSNSIGLTFNMTSQFRHRLLYQTSLLFWREKPHLPQNFLIDWMYRHRLPPSTLIPGRSLLLEEFINASYSVPGPMHARCLYIPAHHKVARRFPSGESDPSDEAAIPQVGQCATLKAVKLIPGFIILQVIFLQKPDLPFPDQPSAQSYQNSSLATSTRFPSRAGRCSMPRLTRYSTGHGAPSGPPLRPNSVPPPSSLPSPAQTSPGAPRPAAQFPWSCRPRLPSPSATRAQSRGARRLPRRQ